MINMTRVPGLVDLTDGESDVLREAYLDGFVDDQTGSVDLGLHHYRVGRFVVETNSDGFTCTAEFDTEASAITFMERIEE